VDGSAVSDSFSSTPFDATVENEAGRTERSRLRLEAQSLLLRVQTDLTGTTEATEGLVAIAEERQWWDVALLALYAQIVGMTSGGQPDELDACRDRLVALAAQTRDPAALALTMAAQAGFLGGTEGPRRAMTAHADLARAVVLLESGQGGAFERIDAHIECGAAFGANRLWELEIDQYVAALAVDLGSEHPDALSDPSTSGGRWAIKANLAEVQCHWVCALYLDGDRTATVEAAAQSLGIFADAADAGLPGEWLPDLDAMRLLTSAIGGEDVSAAAMECLEHLEPASPLAGVAHLAIAVSERTAATGSGLTSIEAAVACLAGSDLVMEYELALSLSVEAEAELLGRETAGLRFVRHHNSHHWSDRIARLNAMVGLINAERFRVERETFERVAHVDDLTKLANRRGYHRYLASFGTGGSRDVAVLAMDVDRFKSINDQFGHLAGDDALRRIGAVLSSQVRTEDLAARIGGDEFVIVLAGASLETATQRAAQVIAMLGRRGRTAGSGFSEPIGVSIGIAAGPAERVEQLHQSADEALYEAKSLGGGRAVGAVSLPAGT
jgi:diguanylate cyclase (GGDEF)-like protein